MLDDYMEEQQVAYQTLIHSLKKDKYFHAYLFETHGNMHAKKIALAFAKYLLCPNKYSNNKMCKNCHQCETIDDNNYIELKIINPDGMWIKKGDLIDLQQEFSKKALTGNKKIYIITDAAKLNDEASNSLLKFLEEPEDNIVAILLTDNKYQLLDTIVSRCQIISLLNTDIDKYDTTFLKLQSLINNEKLDFEKLDKIVDFISYYEENGLDTILNMQLLFHQYFTERNLIEDVFNIMSLFYMDVVNFLCHRNLNIFVEYQANIEKIAKINTMDSLLHKVNVILKLKDLIKYNVNINLLMDKLIIELGGV